MAVPHDTAFSGRGIYFSIACAFNHSGKNGAWKLTHADNNMIAALASAAAIDSFGTENAIFRVFLGLSAMVTLTLSFVRVIFVFLLEAV